MSFLSNLFGGKKADPSREAPAPTQKATSPTPSWQSAGAVPQELAAMEGVALHKSDTPPLFLDVREPEELQASGWIPGSVHIPMHEIQGRMDELNPERPVVVYCAGGVRSMDVGTFLLQQGFKDVSNLNGGLKCWTGPVERK